jgi:hypothetical protein
VVGQTAPEAQASQEVQASNLKQLDQALTEGQSAQQLKVKLSQLKDLADLIDAQGPVGQARVAIIKRLADAGYAAGTPGEAYVAAQQIINSEIPDVRQKAGIQRLAGPAINEERLILGTANMPPNVLRNIVANEQASADAQIQRAALANKVRYGTGPDALSMADYSNQSRDIDAQIQQNTDTLRKQLHTVASNQPPQVSDQPPPAPSIGSTLMDAFHAVGSLFGGGSQAAPPAPAATPTPDQPMQFDIKSGKLVPLPPGQ